MITGHDDLAVDLVADDTYMVFPTDIEHPGQFLLRPHTTTGIMGIAEEKYGDLVVGSLPLEILEVDLISVTITFQLVLHDLTTLVADTGEEAVVGRRLQQYFLAGEGEGLDGTAHSGDDTGGIEDPVTLDLPVMASLEPADDSIVIAVGHEGIAEDGMFHTGFQSLGDGGTDFKVHVSDPERDDVILFRQVPFVGVGASAVHDFIEVVFHFTSLLFYFFNLAVVAFSELRVGDTTDMVGNDMATDRVLDICDRAFDLRVDVRAVLEGTVAVLVEGTVYERHMIHIAQWLFTGDVATNKFNVFAVPCEVFAIELRVVDHHIVTLPETVFRGDLRMMDLDVLAVLEDILRVTLQFVDINIFTEHKRVSALMELYILDLQAIDTPECLIGVIDLDILQGEVLHLAEEFRSVDDRVLHYHVIAVPDGRA